MFDSDRVDAQIEAFRSEFGEFPVVTNERTMDAETIDAGIESAESNVVVDVRTWTTRGDSVLLVREATMPEIGWIEPGGTIDPGETPAEAAARETAEETGINVTITGLRGVCRHRNRNRIDPMHAVDMLQAYFITNPVSGTIDRQKLEIAEVRWFDVLPDSYHSELAPPTDFDR